MKIDMIKQLLSKYYDGSCTQQEQQTLMDYFSKGEVTPELLDEKLIFEQLHNSEKPPVPSTLESRLDTLIDSLDGVNVEEQVVEERRGVRKPLIWISTIAAAASLLLVVGYVQNLSKEEQTYHTTVLKDTYSDPNEAYAVAEETLTYISSKLEIGLSSVNTIQDEVDRSNEIIEKSLKQLKSK